MPENYKILDNKKFMWDGKEYADQGEAQNQRDERAFNDWMIDRHRGCTSRPGKAPARSSAGAGKM